MEANGRNGNGYNGRELKAKKQARRRPTRKVSLPYVSEDEDITSIRREIAFEVMVELLEDMQLNKQDVERSIASLLREVAYKLEKG